MLRAMLATCGSAGRGCLPIDVLKHCPAMRADGSVEPSCVAIMRQRGSVGHLTRSSVTRQEAVDSIVAALNNSEGRRSPLRQRTQRLQDVRLPSRGLTVSLGTDNRQPFAQIVASWARFDRAISRYIKPINGPPTQATTKNAVHEPAMASAARAMP